MTPESIDPSASFPARPPSPWRRTAVLAGLAAFMAAALAVGLRCGSVAIPFSDMPAAFAAAGDDPDDFLKHHVLRNIRLPRLVLGAMVGAALAVAGAVLQGVMRNPLAAPNLIGVSAGGGLAAVAVMVLAPAQVGWISPAAFAGALGATLVVYGLAWRGGLQPMRLILSGIAVASLLGALTTGLLIFNSDKVAGVLDFTVGSLTAKTWNEAATMAPYAFVGLALAWCWSRELNILALGDAMATGLGLRVERTRMILIAVAALLAASAVSTAGLLGFVGLIAPHTVRLMIGSDHRALIPACAVFGAGLVMACDTVGRVVIDPVELPAGVVMAVLGPPFFLYLLRRADPHGA